MSFIPGLSSKLLTNKWIHYIILTNYLTYIDNPMSKLLQKFNESDPALFTPCELVQLLQDASEYEVYSVILRLFETSALHHTITAANITQLQAVSKTYDVIFNDLLFKLPEMELQRIFTPKSIVAMASLRPNDILLSVHLAEFCKKFSITLSDQDTQSLDYSNSRHLEFLAFTSAAINYIDRSAIDPVIAKLLERTYLSHSNKSGFVSQLSACLKDLIDENGGLKELLARSADRGDVLIGDVEYIKSSGLGLVSGLANRESLTISIAGRGSIEEVVSTIVHESTHKLIQMVYQNEAQPFAKDDLSFDSIMQAAKAEVKKSDIAYSFAYINSSPRRATSWISSVVDEYQSDKHSIELLPWFTEQMTMLILKAKRLGSGQYDQLKFWKSTNCSAEFTDTLWQFLHKDLLRGCAQEPLTDIFYRDYAVDSIKGEEGSLSYEAGKLAATLSPEIEWSRSEHGRLAIRASSPHAQEIFIQKLFALPQEDILQVIIQSDILRSWPSSSIKAVFNGLSPKNLQELFIKPLLPSMTAMCCLRELFELEPRKIMKVITRENVEQFRKLAFNESEFDSKLEIKHPLLHRMLVGDRQLVILEDAARVFQQVLRLLKEFHTGPDGLSKIQPFEDELLEFTAAVNEMRLSRDARRAHKPPESLDLAELPESQPHTLDFHEDLTGNESGIFEEAP
jgi:hypothetical protein